jgi:hypothetical protein
MPSSASALLWRLSGRCRPYLANSTCANSNGPARPRAIGCEGALRHRRAGSERAQCGILRGKAGQRSDRDHQRLGMNAAVAGQPFENRVAQVPDRQVGDLGVRVPFPRKIGRLQLRAALPVLLHHRTLVGERLLNHARSSNGQRAWSHPLWTGDVPAALQERTSRSGAVAPP